MIFVCVLVCLLFKMVKMLKMMGMFVFRDICIRLCDIFLVIYLKCFVFFLIKIFMVMIVLNGFVEIEFLVESDVKLVVEFFNKLFVDFLVLVEDDCICEVV